MEVRQGIAGGLAGIAVDCIFYPLEVLKTRMMASHAKESFTNPALGRFRGFSCQMIVSFPSSFFFFLVYESIRSRLGKDYLVNLGASLVAEITSNIVRHPMERIKQQIVVGRASLIVQSFKDIHATTGFSGFFIGLRSTIMRDIFFTGVQMPLYEFIRLKQPIKDYPVLNSSLSGSLAAAISAFVSCPLDVVRTRQMTAKHGEDKEFTWLLRNIYEEAGVRGLFRGAGIRCGMLSFGGIIYFGALQKARELLGVSDVQHNVQK